MNQAQEIQFDECFEKFMAKQPDDFAYVAKDETTGKWSLALVIPTLKKFTALYIEKHNAGVPSISAFEITLRLLVENGDFKPVAVEPQIPAEIAEFIRKAEANQISTYELRKRYSQDRVFKHWYEVHLNLVEHVQPVALTAAEYRSMPTRVTQVRYQKDPAFKAAVQNLIDTGQI